MISSLKSHGADIEGVDAVLVLLQAERNPVMLNPDRRTEWTNCTIMAGLLGQKKLDYYHFHHHDAVAFLVTQTGRDSSGEWEDVLGALLQHAAKNHRILAGASGVFRGFHGLRNAGLEAQKALEEAIDERDAHTEMVELRPPPLVMLTEQEVRGLEYTIRFGSDAELELAIKGEKEKFAGFSNRISDYRPYMLNLLHLVIGFSTAIGVDPNTVNGKDILETVTTFMLPEQLLSWFHTMAMRLREIHLHTNMSNAVLLLKRVTAYMRWNFSDPDLNKEQLCNAVRISSSYLSLLFKEQMGLSFVKYLTRIRLDKAKELLAYSGDRVLEIAEKTGYRDVYYFSNSFKKDTGLSPREYRKILAEKRKASGSSSGSR